MNPRLTFDEFCVGRSNALAYQAACAMLAEPPERQLDTLILCGPPGVGKSHLVEAIAHALLERSPRGRIQRMTLERLLGDLTTASRGSATAELGACLASANLLIVDDVVSLADRPNTQSLLASLLTGVHAARRRLVIASTDSPAHLASTYRDILRRGRVVPIAAPDPDTGRALVAAHAERTGIALSDHQAAKLLAHGDNNPRCLQGLVHRVSALAALHGHSVTDEILTRALEWRR